MSPPMSQEPNAGSKEEVFFEGGNGWHPAGSGQEPRRQGLDAAFPDPVCLSITGEAELPAPSTLPCFWRWGPGPQGRGSKGQLCKEAELQAPQTGGGGSATQPALASAPHDSRWLLGYGRVRLSWSPRGVHLTGPAWPWKDPSLGEKQHIVSCRFPVTDGTPGKKARVPPPQARRGN